MTKQIIVSDPTIDKYDNGHIGILFEDGELCYTKSGGLFGQRNLHQNKGPGMVNVEGITFDKVYNGFNCVYVELKD